MQTNEQAERAALIAAILRLQHIFGSAARRAATTHLSAETTAGLRRQLSTLVGADAQRKESAHETARGQTARSRKDTA